MTAARCSCGIAAESARRAAEERDAEAGAADDAPRRGRATLESVAAASDDQQHARARARPSRRPRRPTARVRPKTSWATAAEPASAKTPRPGDEVVGRVEQRRRELRAEREEQAADRPRRDDAERGEQERAGAPRRDARPLRRQAQARARRRPARASARRPRRRSRRARTARRRAARAARAANSTKRGGDEHAEAHARRRSTTPLVSPTPAGSRRGCRSSSAALAAPSASAGREPLHAAGDEQPDDRVGEHEEHGRAHERAERDEQDRPAADLVGHAAGEEQRGEHAERVGRVDEREDERREAPELAVDAVERRRRARREQRQADDRAGERVGDARRERAARWRWRWSSGASWVQSSFDISKVLEAIEQLYHVRRAGTTERREKIAHPAAVGARPGDDHAHRRRPAAAGHRAAAGRRPAAPVQRGLGGDGPAGLDRAPTTCGCCARRASRARAPRARSASSRCAATTSRSASPAWSRC